MPSIGAGDVKHAVRILGIDPRDAIETTVTPHEVRVRRLVRGMDGRHVINPVTRLPRVVVETYPVVAD